MTRSEWIKAVKMVLWDVSMSPDYPWAAEHLCGEARRLFYTAEYLEDEEKRAQQASLIHDHVQGRMENDAMCEEGV